MWKTIKNEINPTLKLAIPMIFTQLLVFGQQIIDTVMSGRHGAITLASVSLANQLFSLIYLLAIGVSIGFSAQISHHHGSDNRHAIRCDFQQGVWLHIISGIIVTCLTVAFAFLPAMMGSQADIACQAKAYLLTLAIPAGIFVFGSLARAFFEGSEYPRAIAIVQSILLPVNALGNWFFLSYTHLGATGMAISTGICYFLYTGILFAMIVKSRRWQRYRLFQKFARLNWSIIRRLTHIGLPIGITILMEAGIFSFIGIMASRENAIITGANQVAFNYISIMFMVPLGLSSAVTIRCANAFGQNNWQAIAHRAYTGIALAGFIMFIASVVILIAHKQIPKIYSNNVEIIKVASHILLIATLFEIADGIQIAANAVLRGLHDTRIPIIYAFICYWCLGVPIGCFLAYSLGLGIYGLWIGCALGLCIFAGLNLRRVHQHIQKHLSTRISHV